MEYVDCPYIDWHFRAISSSSCIFSRIGGGTKGFRGSSVSRKAETSSAKCCVDLKTSGDMALGSPPLVPSWPRSCPGIETVSPPDTAGCTVAPSPGLSLTGGLMSAMSIAGCVIITKQMMLRMDPSNDNELTQGSKRSGFWETTLQKPREMLRFQPQKWTKLQMVIDYAALVHSVIMGAITGPFIGLHSLVCPMGRIGMHSRQNM